MRASSNGSIASSGRNTSIEKGKTRKEQRDYEEKGPFKKNFYEKYFDY